MVRHAPVAIEPDIPPERWHLSEAGRTAAGALADGAAWDDVVQIYHSPQPKTAETAEALGRRLGIPRAADPDLREVRMDVGFLPTAEFEGRVGAWLAGADDTAFEPYADAERRILRCVRGIVADAAGRSAVVVTHGRILAVFFGALLGSRVDVDGWRSIGMPDMAVVDLDRGAVTAGFFAGRPIRALLRV
jgi:broad specificity phosphatase PhoE